MNAASPSADLNKLLGHLDSSVVLALDEQRDALWLAQCIVDSVVGSLKDKFDHDWPANLPDWPRALRSVSQMIAAAADALEAPTLEDRAAALTKASHGAEVQS